MSVDGRREGGSRCGASSLVADVLQGVKGGYHVGGSGGGWGLEKGNRKNAQTHKITRSGQTQNCLITVILPAK